MAVLQKILDILSQRIASLVGGALASRLETMVMLEQVDQQDELEERARRLEKEGKADLAEVLRRRTLRVDPNEPGGQGKAILARLCDETPPDDNPALLEHGPEEVEARPKRRRRTSKRNGNSRPATTEEARDE